MEPAIRTAEKPQRVSLGGPWYYYRPSTDTIQLPPREAFVGSATSNPTEAFYSTLLHELTHWTAPEARCNRELGKRFGDAAYAMEELVAELGAAFLCADLGIAAAPRADHAQYLASRLNVLKADKKAIFTAASTAGEAVRFLMEPGGAYLLHIGSLDWKKINPNIFGSMRRARTRPLSTACANSRWMRVSWIST